MHRPAGEWAISTFSKILQNLAQALGQLLQKSRIACFWHGQCMVLLHSWP
jgi:hypothetical protein